MNPTKKTIIKTTISMIESSKLEKVSMRELGKNLNLSRTAVYRHFKNKEELLSYVVSELFEELYKKLEVLTVKESNPQHLTKMLLLEYYNFGANHHELYSLLFLKNWTDTEYKHIKKAATKLFWLLDLYTPKHLNTAISFSFIHGLINLHNNGHVEIEKGLNDPELLISSFVNNLFS